MFGQATRLISTVDSRAVHHALCHGPQRQMSPVRPWRINKSMLFDRLGQISGRECRASRRIATASSLSAASKRSRTLSGKVRSTVQRPPDTAALRVGGLPRKAAYAQRSSRSPASTGLWERRRPARTWALKARNLGKTLIADFHAGAASLVPSRSCRAPPDRRETSGSNSSAKVRGRGREEPSLISEP